MILTTLAALHLFAATNLDIDMNSQDQRNSGVYKLNNQEKASLQQWIDTNYQKRSAQPQQEMMPPPNNSMMAPPPTTRSVKGTTPTLSENLMNSKYLRLSDGTLWNVRDEDVPIAQSWITPVEIVVSNSSNPFFPFRLTNTVSGSSILVRKADKLPRAATPQTPSTPAPTTAPKPGGMYESGPAGQSGY